MKKHNLKNGKWYMVRNLQDVEVKAKFTCSVKTGMEMLEVENGYLRPYDKITGTGSPLVWETAKELFDFYYSVTTEKNQRMISEMSFPSRKARKTYVDDIQYTECTYHGVEPVCKVDDAELVYTGLMESITFGTMYYKGW